MKIARKGINFLELSMAGSRLFLNKIYEYHRSGILDEIPHLKIDQSSLIIREDEFDKILIFLKGE